MVKFGGNLLLSLLHIGSVKQLMLDGRFTTVVLRNLLCWIPFVRHLVEFFDDAMH